MSELKAKTVYDVYWKANSVGEGTGTQVYLKSEADKVIAEKDKQIRRQKHQRYIAMARWCKNMADWWDCEQRDCLLGQHGNGESPRFKMAHSKFCHYVKRQQLWQELADKLEEAK